MQRKPNSLHPPVQGVQITAMISCIRLNALDTTLTPDERASAMKHNHDQAIEMLEAYYQHWVKRSTMLP